MIKREATSQKSVQHHLSPLEKLLLQSRLLVLIAVVASLVLSLAIFFIATVDVITLVINLSAYADLSLNNEARNDLRAESIGYAISILDAYLMGSIMLIFAAGMYDLFIRKNANEEAEMEDESRTSLGRTQSLDDLKDRLAKVVLLVLQIEVFKYALRIQPDQPVALVLVAITLLILAITVFMSQKKANGDKGLSPRG